MVIAFIFLLKPLEAQQSIFLEHTCFCRYSIILFYTPHI